MPGNTHDQRDSHLLSVREVAEHLGCSQANVYGLINRGCLPVIRVGQSKGYRVDPHDLETFLRQRKVQYEAAELVVPRPRLKHIEL